MKTGWKNEAMLGLKLDESTGRYSADELALEDFCAREKGRFVISDCELKNVDFDRVVFSGTRFRRVIFDCCTFSFAEFEDVVVEESASFRNCKFNSTKFLSSIFKGSIIRSQFEGLRVGGEGFLFIGRLDGVTVRFSSSSELTVDPRASFASLRVSGGIRRINVENGWLWEKKRKSLPIKERFSHRCPKVEFTGIEAGGLFFEELYSYMVIDCLSDVGFERRRLGEKDREIIVYGKPK